MIETIVFLVEMPFSRRDYERFGIEIIITNGFAVEVWDLTLLLHPDIAEGYTVPDPIDFDRQRKYGAFADVCSAIAAGVNLFVVAIIGYSYKSDRVFRQLNKHKIPYAINMSNSIPTPYDRRDTKNDLLFRFLNSKDKKDKLLNMLYRRFFINNYRPGFILAGGQESVKDWSHSTTEIVWTHALDYDYMFAKASSSDISGDSVVFLDIFAPFHPDFLIRGEKSPFKVDKYYSQVCEFFTEVERDTGLEVIIAAHPRADYSDKEYLFGGRKIVYGKTFDLVRKSTAVITQSSTAINFPIMLKKPIILIISNEFRNNEFGYFIEKTAEIIGKKPIDIEEPYILDWDKEMLIDDRKYEDYIQMYIKTAQSKQKPFWQIFCDRIKDLD